MPVTDIVETFDGRENTYTGNYREADLKEERRWVKVFHVIDDSTDLDTVLTNAQLTGTQFISYSNGALGFPIQWDKHPINSDYVAKEFHVRQLGSDVYDSKVITVTYVLYQDPTLLPAEVEWDKGSYERVVEGAFTAGFVNNQAIPNDPLNRYPLTNSAYDPFDPPPVWQEPYRIIKVTKHFKPPLPWGDDQNLIKNYVKRLNFSDYTVKDATGQTVTYPSGTVLMDEPPVINVKFSDNAKYYVCKFTFKVRDLAGSGQSWDLRLADLGFRYWDNINSVPVPIFVGGQAAQNPQKLDGSGNQLAINQPTVYLSYQIFATAEFGDLQLFT